MLLMAHRSDLRGVLNKIGIRGYLYFYKGLKSNNMKEGEKAKYIWITYECGLNRRN